VVSIWRVLGILVVALWLAENGLEVFSGQHLACCLGYWLLLCGLQKVAWRCLVVSIWCVPGILVVAWLAESGLEVPSGQHVGVCLGTCLLHYGLQRVAWRYMEGSTMSAVTF